MTLVVGVNRVVVGGGAEVDCSTSIVHGTWAIFVFVVFMTF